MTGLRDDRELAVRRRLRDLGDNPGRWLPVLLDDLEAIDAQHPPEPVAVKRADDTPSDAEIGEWIRRNPQAMEAWARKRNRINGGDVRSVLGDAPASVPPLTSMPQVVMETPQAAQPAAPAAPAKPPARRRTAK